LQRLERGNGLQSIGDDQHGYRLFHHAGLAEIAWTLWTRWNRLESLIGLDLDKMSKKSRRRRQQPKSRLPHRVPGWPSQRSEGVTFAVDRNTDAAYSVGLAPFEWMLAPIGDHTDKWIVGVLETLAEHTSTGATADEILRQTAFTNLTSDVLRPARPADYAKAHVLCDAPDLWVVNPEVLDACLDAAMATAVDTCGWGVAVFPKDDVAYTYGAMERAGTFPQYDPNLDGVAAPCELLVTNFPPSYAYPKECQLILNKLMRFMLCDTKWPLGRNNFPFPVTNSVDLAVKVFFAGWFGMRELPPLDFLRLATEAEKEKCRFLSAINSAYYKPPASYDLWAIDLTKFLLYRLRCEALVKEAAAAA